MRPPTALHMAKIAGPAPIGPVLIASDGRALVALDFGTPEERFAGLLRARFGVVTLTHADDPQGFASAVRAYFAGDMTALDSLPKAEVKAALENPRDGRNQNNRGNRGENRAEVSNANEPAPLWKTCLATSARVIWKFSPNVPTMNTRAIGASRWGRCRT